MAAFMGAHRMVERPCMYRSKHPFWVQADMLHDVYFPTVGPSTINILSGQHPESRPDALRTGQFHHGLKTPISPVAFVDGTHTGRGVIRPHVAFLFGDELQFSIAHRGVVRPVGIVLEFVVAPATCACLEAPFGQVYCRTIKFVVPDEFVALGREGDMDQERKRKE